MSPLLSQISHTVAFKTVENFSLVQIGVTMTCIRLIRRETTEDTEVHKSHSDMEVLE